MICFDNAKPPLFTATVFQKIPDSISYAEAEPCVPPERLFFARVALTLSGGLVQLVHHTHLEVISLYDDVHCRNILLRMRLDKIVNMYIDELVKAHPEKNISAVDIIVEGDYLKVRMMHELDKTA